MVYTTSIDYDVKSAKTQLGLKSQIVSVAKNYLNEAEIKLLGLLSVSLIEQFLAFAEAMAQQQTPMYMDDWIKRLDAILQINGRELLTNAGEISRKMMLDKADLEYAKYSKQRKELEKIASLQELEADLKDLARLQK